MQKHTFNIFPEMIGEDFQRLKAEIESNGFDSRYPICTYQGDILDGWNRYRICSELGIEPVFEEFVGSDEEALEFVMRSNKRRNLTSSQWATIAIENTELVEKLKEQARERQGERVDLTFAKKFANVEERKTSKKLAKMFNTNDRYIEQVSKIKSEDPEGFEKIKSGEKTISEYRKEDKIIKRKAYIEEQRKQIENIEQPEGKFGVIVVDPPWSYGREYDPETSRVANPYPEMSQEELLKLELPSEDDSVLFLWTTHSFLFNAKELLDSWGYEYKAMLVWDKEKMGMGSWFRMQCEFCLVGIKGKPLWENKAWRDIIREPRREHSRKPDLFYKMVEDITVGRRLDYFSRETRDGWSTFGNEKKF